MNFSQQRTEIEVRRPVWEALSEMFLDTDTSLSRASRVRKLVESPYTIEEIEAILIDEIYPVCRMNLLSIAGEWSGFEPQWLEQRVLERLTSPFRFLHALNLGRLTIHLSSEWQATKREINTARAMAKKSAA